MKFTKIILSVFTFILISNHIAFSADSNTVSEANVDISKVAEDNVQKEKTSDLNSVKTFKTKKFKFKRLKRKLIRKILKDDPELEDEVLLVILAILLPPLAVYLVEGIGNLFWIDLILTILGWLPGIIFALYVILR